MLREVKSVWIFKKMFINFIEKGYSGIIPFVYEGKEEIHTDTIGLVVLCHAPF